MANLSVACTENFGDKVGAVQAALAVSMSIPSFMLGLDNFETLLKAWENTTKFGKVLRWRMVCLLSAGPLHAVVTMTAVALDHSSLLSTIPSFQYSWLIAYGLSAGLAFLIKGLREVIHGFMRKRIVDSDVPDASNDPDV